jgi:hypothetical protein
MNALPWMTKPPRPAPVDPIKSAIDEYAKLNKEIAEREKLKEQLSKTIKKLGFGEHEGGNCIASVTEVITKGFDKDAFLADEAREALYQKYMTKETRSVKLTIKALI